MKKFIALFIGFLTVALHSMPPKHFQAIEEVQDYIEHGQTGKFAQELISLYNNADNDGKKQLIDALDLYDLSIENVREKIADSEPKIKQSSDQQLITEKRNLEQDTSQLTFSPEELKKMGLYDSIDTLAINKNDPDLQKKLVSLFTFNAKNSFARGEKVAVMRTGDAYKYGVVLGMISSGPSAGYYTIQVTRDPSFPILDASGKPTGQLAQGSKAIPVQQIGKLGLYSWFTEDELKKLNKYHDIGRLMIPADAPNKVELAGELFDFDAENSFEPEELVGVLRGDGSYKIGIIFKHESNNRYAVQVSAKPIIDIKDANGKPTGFKKPGFHYGLAAQKIGKLRKAHEWQNQKVAGEGIQPFTKEQLENIRVFTPAALSIGKVMVDAKTIKELGYSFSENNKFFRGEAVVISPPNSHEYILGIVNEETPDNEYIVILPLSSIKIKGIGYLPFRLKAGEIGKYFVNQNFEPQQDGTLKLFTAHELKKLPLPNTALRIIGTQPTFLTNLLNAEYAVEDQFNFASNNSFKRGDLVVVKFPDAIYRYGIVVGRLGDKQYIIQTTVEGTTQIFTADHIGKPRFIFSLMKAKDFIKNALYEKTPLPPEVIGLITEQSSSALADIKHAIVSHDIKAFKEMLEKNKAHLEDVDDQGYTPLLFAIYTNNFPAVEYLIEKGANVRAKKDGMDALALAEWRKKHMPEYNLNIISELVSQVSPALKERNKILCELEKHIGKYNSIAADVFDSRLKVLLEQLKPLLTPEQLKRLEKYTQEIFTYTTAKEEYWTGVAYLLPFIKELQLEH